VSTRAIKKLTPLRCKDCGHEFVGQSVRKEHYVEGGTVLAKTVFDRALDDCLACGSHRVEARGA
jgi:hypothetical protein